MLFRSWIHNARQWPDFLRRCGFGVNDFGVPTAAVARVVVLELQTVDLSCNLRQQVIRQAVEKVAQFGFAQRFQTQELFRLEDSH